MADDPTSRQSPNTLKTRVVPIIFVPGIMGTRLSFDQGEPKMKWDPDKGFREMLPWKRLTATEKARVLNYKNPATIIDEKVDNGWGALAKDFYEDFHKALASKGKFAGAKTPVYAVGYDWRQSCATSAKHLKTNIERIVEIERARHAIVVTHSMGGLVTRSALKQTPGLDPKVLGVAHITQPVAGAVVLYRRVFTGMSEKWDGDKHITKILGNNPYEFIVPMSGILGVFELLPTHQYRYLPSESPEDPAHGEIAKLRGPWESSEKGRLDSSRRTVYPHGISRRYLDQNSPPGLFHTKIHGSKDPGETAKTKTDVAAGVQSASGFHESLGLYYHKNTWSIYSTGRYTDVAVKYPVIDDKFDDLLLYRKEQGDGTVPDASAAALFASSVEATAENARVAENRQFFVKGAEHAKVVDNKTVRDVLFQLIYQMIRYS